MKKKDIYLPHIKYKVRVRQFVQPPDELKKALAYVQSDGMAGCTLYLDLKKKIVAGDLAHELVHVLQFICLNRNIDFVTETEHMGYIMHYLMGEIMGQKYV